MRSTQQSPLQIVSNLRAQCLIRDARQHGGKRCLDDELLCRTLVKSPAHQIKQLVRIHPPDADGMVPVYIPLMGEHQRDTAVACMRGKDGYFLIFLAD